MGSVRKRGAPASWLWMVAYFLWCLVPSPAASPSLALCSLLCFLDLSSSTSRRLLPTSPHPGSNLTVQRLLGVTASVTVAASERQLLPCFFLYCFCTFSFSLTSFAAVCVVSRSDTYTACPAICSASPRLQLPNSQPAHSILVLACCHYCLLLLAPLPLCWFCSFFLQLGRHS